MKKINLRQCFAAVAVIGAVLVFPEPSSAAATFPVDQAGMAAYVKLSAIDVAVFDRAKQNLFDSVESFGPAHIIGIKQYSVTSTDYNKITYHIYLGADGWLVVYLTKDQEPTRIVNWTSGASLDNTMLKLIINDALAKINVAAAEPMKYYNFSHPDAAKMTFVRENAGSLGSNSSTNDFTILIPGTIYQASYTMNCTDCQMASWRVPGNIYLDNTYIDGLTYDNGPLRWGNYPLDKFTANASHTISINRDSTTEHPVAVTLVLYETN